MVDEVIELDAKYRAAIQTRCDELRAQRNKIVQGDRRSDGQGSEGRGREGQGRGKGYGRRDDQARRRTKRPSLRKSRKRMMVIPNIIDPSVPIGKDDSRERRDRDASASRSFRISRFRITLISWSAFDGIDLDAARTHLRQRLLLPEGRYRPSALRDPVLCARFHDRPRLHLLHPAVHDPRRRRQRALCPLPRWRT